MNSRHIPTSLVAIVIAGLAMLEGRAQSATATTLDVEGALRLALQKNPGIRKAQEELRRTHGIIVETRAAAFPQVTATGQYREIDKDFIDVFPGGTGVHNNQRRPWSATIELSQLLYSGGRIHAALRAARLTDQIAILDFQRVVADTILSVRTTCYRILLDVELVSVREHSMALLERQLEDVRHRFEAGTVAQFNVLRAEVELANARPPLIRARNELRLAKESLAKLLALDTPGKSGDFTPLILTGKLEFQARDWKLDDALSRALAQRPELLQSEKRAELQKQALTVATAGYKPELSAFADYGIRDSTFSDNVDQTINGWTVGVGATWNIFDGMLTKGKVEQARATLVQAQLDHADTRRVVELEVRQAYSDYLQALELIEAQKKTVEQGEESLRLAEARFRAGTGTQLDVLSAQTALTEARSNQIQALHAYQVALAALDRATGAAVKVE